MIDQNRVRQMSRLAMMEPEIKKDVMGICSRAESGLCGATDPERLFCGYSLLCCPAAFCGLVFCGMG